MLCTITSTKVMDMVDSLVHWRSNIANNGTLMLCACILMTLADRTFILKSNHGVAQFPTIFADDFS